MFQQLTQSTVIDACLSCSFTSSRVTNLILSIGDHLDVYELQRNNLTFACAIPLFGKPEALAAFRPCAGASDHLALVFRRGRYLAVLGYDAEFGAARTCGQHMLIPPDDPSSACGPVGFQPQLAVDPDHRCLIVHALPDRVVVFPIDKGASWQHDAGPVVSQQGGLAFHQDMQYSPGLGTPFTFSLWAALRLRHLEDIVFLHGYHQPTIACLGQAKPGWGGSLTDTNRGNTSALVVVLDLTEKTPHLVWATHNLPHDLFKLIALKPPVHGVLALSKNAAIYLKEHGPAFCQTLNLSTTLGDEYSKLGMLVKDETRLAISLAGCAVTTLEPEVLLFSISAGGRLYLAHLVMETADTVADIVWTSPGAATPAAALCSVGADHVFLAAASGASPLLKITSSKKKLPPHLQPPKKKPRTEPKDDANGEGKVPAQTPSEEMPELLALHESFRTSARFIKSFSTVVAEELLSFGAIRCLAPWCRARSEEEEDAGAGDAGLCGTARLICCGGQGSRGALYILQRAVPLEGLAEFDVAPQCSVVWTFRFPVDEPLITEVPLKGAGGKERPQDGRDDTSTGEADENDCTAAAAVADAVAAAAEEAAAAPRLPGRAAYSPHRLVLLSGTSKTMVLEATNEIEEISPSVPLDTTATTVGAGAVLSDRLIVQVTPQRMRFMWSRNPKSDSVPRALEFGSLVNDKVKKQDEDEDGAAPPRARSSSIFDPYIAVLFDDQSLRLFGVRGDAHVRELSKWLPNVAAHHVCCASVCRPRMSHATLLTVVTPASGSTLRILELRSMTEVFRVEHLVDVPPVLRNSAQSGGNVGHELDHLRALMDVCALLPKGANDAQPPGREVAGMDHFESAAAPAVICAELVDVDLADRGPTLIVLVVGRPVLVYRAFRPHPPANEEVASQEGPTVARTPEGGPSAVTPAAATVASGASANSCPPNPASTSAASSQSVFPYHFSLHEHQFVGLVESRPPGPYRPVVPIRHPPTSNMPGGSGAIVVPPHAGVPALWLAAARNRLFVHPLPGDQFRGFAPLHAPCCDSGFFALSQGANAVVAQVFTHSTLEGLPDGSAGFELCAPIPFVRVQLKQTPQCLATRPADEAIALAVSEVVSELPEPSGPTIEEDPLSDDWSIIRAPPIEDLKPPPVPRLHSRYTLWVDKVKDLAKLGQYRFSFDSDEQVLCLAWVTIPGFPTPSLAVGTGVNTGEDLTCRGRVLIFSTKDREPGVLPATYQRSLKWPVTVVGQWGSYFVHSEGYKLFFERWESTSFNKLAFFDGSMCITSLSSIKNFLLLGDLRKGIDFAQWKEDAGSQTRNLRRLSRSSPLAPMTVLACDFVVCQKSLGLVALDSSGSAHLFQYTAHSDGREGDQLLRSCATFSMGFPCRAALRLQTEPGIHCLFMASAGGELLCLRPIDDQVYRTVTTLLGMLATRLPFICGLNPRAFRHHDGPPTLVAPRKNIEDTLLLRHFAFLCTPLQASIADKMRLPLMSLLRTTMPCATCQLYNLRPEAVPEGGLLDTATIGSK